MIEVWITLLHILFYFWDFCEFIRSNTTYDRSLLIQRNGAGLGDVGLDGTFNRFEVGPPNPAHPDGG